MTWGALEGVSEDHRAAFTARAFALARDAAATDGVQTLMLPPARVTAVHEAGHAILHAMNGAHVGCITIRERRSLGGFCGLCELADPASEPDLIPHLSPHRALERAAVEIAGWCGEMTFEPDGFRLGSSLDETVLAGGIIAGAARALGRDPERLFYAVSGAVIWLLESERAAARAIQRALLREGRIRGPKLAALLATVNRRNIANLILFGPDREG